ncbi:hypothetical protein [Sphingomonas sp. F9_3S_D5_B_2]
MNKAGLGRSEWLEQLSEALEDALGVASELVYSTGCDGKVVTLYAEIDAARREAKSLRYEFSHERLRNVLPAAPE